MKKLSLLYWIVALVISCTHCTRVPDPIPPDATDDIQYLIFQIFTYNPSSNGEKQPLDGVAIRNQINQIQRQ